ncbi:MAG: type II secretion system F family protein [Mogibacterium sp.]|nr:type II secretion system F family protein [Mogibacterium sp.]MBR0341927.1 type II secretion system F family protein [Oscillospiraceae bacterium]
MSKYKKLLQDKKLMSGIYAVTLVTALLILALVVKGPEESGRLIADGNGNIIGINRRSLDRSERYDLSLEIKDENETVTRDVTLTLQAGSDRRDGMRRNEKENREAELEAAVDNMISGIEYSKEKKIKLPSALPDGTAVRWTGGEQSAGPVIVIIPLMYVSLVILMAANSMRGDRTAAEERRSIIRGLPRFCNQLYLMMNAGLILSDAFDTISAGYRMNESCSSFEKDLAELQETTDGHRVSTAQVINEYAVKHDVKEMIRIAAILTENEKRGSDVVESLERESRYLWDERKTVARECGKAIDTKMSYPLGLLLIVLIVITMAPALLNI